jgi:hypothetical protein
MAGREIGKRIKKEPQINADSRGFCLTAENPARPLAATKKIRH